MQIRKDARDDLEGCPEDLQTEARFVEEAFPVPGYSLHPIFSRDTPMTAGARPPSTSSQ